jgi:very-short-patch-repair endonuclease
MRDIRDDLEERVSCVAQQINAENTGFERLISQLKAERQSELEHLKAQLRLANKLIDFTVWHEKLCAQLSARIAVAEAAENVLKPNT